MKAHLITGYAGEEHIMSEDQGSFNAAFFGGGQYVMESGCQFEGSIIDNNTVRILDGDLLMYGRHIRIKPDTYEDLTITTGTAGTSRIDLVCMTYEKNTSDGTEKAYLQVIMGEESEGTAVMPKYTDGNILEGATFNQMPLYSVTIEGVVLKEITPIFATIPSYGALGEKYEAEFIEACRTHLDSLNILDTLEEVDANTQKNQLAGALAVKEMASEINENLTEINDSLANGNIKFSVESDGAYVAYKVGADTVTKKLGEIEPMKDGSCHIAPNNTGSGYSRSATLAVSKNYDKAMLLICTGIDNSSTQDTSVSVDNGSIVDTIRTGSPSYFGGSEAIGCFLENVIAGTMTVTCRNIHSASSSTNYRVQLIGLS